MECRVYIAYLGLRPGQLLLAFDLTGQSSALLITTIEIFEPGFDVASTRAKRSKKRFKLFKQGQLSATVIDVLREARGLTTSKVVGLVMKALGAKEDARDALAPRIRSNLQYLERYRGTCGEYWGETGYEVGAEMIVDLRFGNGLRQSDIEQSNFLPCHIAKLFLPHGDFLERRHIQ